MALDNERIRRIIDLMTEKRIDAFLCHLPENVVFFSGFWPLTGTSWVIFTNQGETHLVVPACEAGEAMECGISLTIFEWAHLAAKDPEQETVSALQAFFEKAGIE